MKKATFYLLQQQKIGEYDAIISIACDLAATAWRSGKRVLISCENEEQALNIDEVLWARDPDQFVPHNLSGESTTYATPVEISWKEKRNTQRRDLLINLQNQLPDFISSFNQIIDFVPVEETQKVQARERYKQLRQLGWQLDTEKID
ncbi:DNA polymerase III subunit chi [Phocoenobacter skyensis]|uniref:DNA polymerase III subunit chi n=1 Tax=Phocoenobacter skyensis TaxID=97481 RepID=A0A1H7W706_9PAST|nr:DNA polymerase III subunit chi [Pasteurella skyensis]MDP8079140.1 DNA polymerase III subunit chi [Pasteurella skyensis]MDP8085090.1 DNA polymerase III subunit chi [Pasteurella skyensis]MDP8185015.1 DNA polymerase III subunit chi [Pasteurella skyensis]QLB23068.1 DNA polymerase III subunit chi [Pasteurella skyensis]SEM17281.1 DNA polymerase III, chi subunit [Pasteurella skyensis]